MLKSLFFLFLIFLCLDAQAIVCPEPSKIVKSVREKSHALFSDGIEPQEYEEFISFYKKCVRTIDETVTQNGLFFKLSAKKSALFFISNDLIIEDLLALIQKHSNDSNSLNFAAWLFDYSLLKLDFDTVDSLTSMYVEFETKKKLFLETVAYKELNAEIPENDKNILLWSAENENFDFNYIDFSSGKYIVAVTSQYCQFSRAFTLWYEENLTTIKKTNQIYAKTIFLANVRNMNEYLYNYERNRETRIPVNIAIDPPSFYFVKSWNTPQIFFLNEGVIVSVMSGWHGDDEAKNSELFFENLSTLIGIEE